MQDDGAEIVLQARSAASSQNGPADNAPCDLLGQEVVGAYGTQPLNTVVASPASGACDLWAEVKGHWLDARLSA